MRILRRSRVEGAVTAAQKPEPIAASRRWLVVSERTERRYFEGIEAESADGAIRAWENGEGELNIDMTTMFPWVQRAEEMRRG